MNAAIILCGGRSRRMGRDKCQIVVGRQSMIGHVLRAVHGSVDRVCVVGRHQQKDTDVIPAEFRETTLFVTDALPDRGPLEGLQIGLSALPDSIRYILLCGCDIPLLKPKVIELLFRLAEGSSAAIPWINGEPCPMPAVYQRSKSLYELAKMASTDERSLWKLAERLAARQVTKAELEQVDPMLESLINVNDDATLQSVERIWAQRQPASS